MAFVQIPTRTTLNANASADINQLQDNDDWLKSNQPEIESGAGAPSSTPGKLMDVYLDTTAKRMYISTGTSSSADWDKVSVYDSDTETMTSGGGDVTVNLKWDWTGGFLIVFWSATSTDYMENSAYHWISTYQALASGTYNADQVIGLNASGNNITTSAKTDNNTAMPNAATSTSFTLKDSTPGSDIYVKWMVFA